MDKEKENVKDTEEMKLPFPQAGAIPVDFDTPVAPRTSTASMIPTAKSSFSSRWCSLPSDLIAHLSRYLDSCSLISLTRVDSQTRKTLISSDFLWIALANQPAPPLSLRRWTLPHHFATEEFTKRMEAPSILALQSSSPRQFVLIRLTTQRACVKIAQRREMERQRQERRSGCCSCLSMTMFWAFLTFILLTITFVLMLVQLTSDTPQLTVSTFIPVFLLLAFCISMTAFHIWFHWSLSIATHPPAAPILPHEEMMHLQPIGAEQFLINIGGIELPAPSPSPPPTIVPTVNTIMVSCKDELHSLRLPFLPPNFHEDERLCFIAATIRYIHWRDHIPSGRTHIGIVSILLLVCIFIVLVILKITRTIDSSWTYLFIPMYACSIPVAACLIWTAMLSPSLSHIFSLLFLIIPSVLANIRLIHEDREGEESSNGGILLIYILLPMIALLELPLLLLNVFSCFCAPERIHGNWKSFIYLIPLMTLQLLWILHVDREDSSVPIYAVFIPLFALPLIAFVDALGTRLYRFRPMFSYDHGHTTIHLQEIAAMEAFGNPGDAIPQHDQH